MSDELVDICDESNNVTNTQKMKSEAHKYGLWHRSAHIWIYNSKGEVLLQLRAKEKALYPDVWDVSVAGHVGANEDPVVSGLREIKEEIGLEVKAEDLQFLTIRKVEMVYKDINNNEFYYIYLLKFDGDNNFSLQDEEVQKIEFVPIKKIEEDLKTNPDKYVPHGDYWFETIDEIKKRLEK
ncbi:MAG: NUDIX hydrolase [Candidatus Magasanikbacteria bacterium GW2011_GWA2_37_8]|uniref:NUDIX hydrolase n=1 Tax=Candidatus Magasanikbacteria bacterium GW2011_GWA2_37_8 TaxID=1619036 RepID=A0A0G0JTJ6_9BACT|nr:MAG: NUDIX hydrolase [Candidatus Magasanikbacteria bacterium GW2011_GWA2_37_8]